MMQGHCKHKGADPMILHWRLDNADHAKVIRGKTIMIYQPPDGSVRFLTKDTHNVLAREVGGCN